MIITAIAAAAAIHAGCDLEKPSGAPGCRQEAVDALKLNESILSNVHKSEIQFSLVIVRLRSIRWQKYMVIHELKRLPCERAQARGLGHDAERARGRSWNEGPLAARSGCVEPR